MKGLEGVDQRLLDKLEGAGVPDTFRETITEMDEQTRRLLLMQLKLVCEEVYNNRFSSANWEVERYKSISNYSKVTVPAYCQECHVKPPLLVDIFDHLDSIASAGRAYNLEKSSVYVLPFLLVQTSRNISWFLKVRE